MLVDSPLSQSHLTSLPYSSNFEDFFNLDLLSSAGGSSSRSSSRSPSGSFAQLPLTPPQPIHLSPEEHDSLFTFLPDDDFLKSVDPLAALSSAPYDFLGAFNTLSSASGSPASAGAQSSTAASPAYQFAIDPQLVGTPASSKAQSEIDDDEDGPGGDDDEDDDGLLAPIKVGGKGMGRKGTVHSGGVTKKSGGAAKESKDKDLDDDWRPSPEEYQKMSSKEKRQLRNKISARNFRVRRKEYIHTLEGDIAERDRLIDAIRGELGTTRSENYALRQEVDTLKKAMLEGRASPMLPPPAPLSPLSPTTPALARAASPLVTLNTQKDLPTSPHLASRAFWGGSQTFGGITPVHTTLVPDFSLSPLLSGKPAAAIRRTSPPLQENMNPVLNTRVSGAGRPLTSGGAANQLPAGFDAFADAHPFTLKALDAYRMQLWGTMAAHHHLREQQRSAQSPTPVAPLTGLASALRPHYFTAKPTSLATMRSGKFGLPTPPSSPPRLHAQMPQQQTREQGASAQHAMIAALASQTLLQKMGHAFWDAFSGGSGVAASGSAPPRAWDADKVRRVLEGTAVLRVVDVEPPKPRVSSPDALAESMRTLSLAPAKEETLKDRCFFTGLRSPAVAVKK